jgi:putative membrane protein
MKRVLLLATVAGLSLPLMGSASSRPAAVPDDAAILARFADLVNADIACAQLAAERGHAKEVRDFAKTLVSEHGLAHQLARDVAAQINTTLKTSSDSPRAAEHAKMQKALRERPDIAFDVLFVRHEVEYHKELVELINKEWIPAAKSADLSSLLTQAGPAFENHLAMAMELQKTRIP